MSLLSAEDLAVTIAGHRICKGLSFAVEPGECWGILGANGTGKTTLLHTLAGLRAANAGTVLLAGTPIDRFAHRDIARHLGLMPQENHDPFPTTVQETALIGRHPWLGAWQWEGEADVTIARAALADVDLAALADRPVTTLSGGERRRLALATLLTQAPRIALLDEPSNHLDLHHQVRLLELVTRRTREEEGALLMTLHDLNLADRFCDHLLLLQGDGEACFGTAAAVLDETILARLYGHPIHIVDDGHRRAFLPA